MARILFQTEAQKERFEKLWADLLYRRRLVKDVAEPLVKTRDEVMKQLAAAAKEVGLPETAQQFVVKDDGVYFASPGQTWDQEKEMFVDPPAPAKPAKKTAKKASRRPAKKSRKRPRKGAAAR